MLLYVVTKLLVFFYFLAHLRRPAALPYYRIVNMCIRDRAVGACKAGIIDEEKLCEFENNTCPGCGSCSGTGGGTHANAFGHQLAKDNSEVSDQDDNQGLSQ